MLSEAKLVAVAADRSPNWADRSSDGTVDSACPLLAGMALDTLWGAVSPRAIPATAGRHTPSPGGAAVQAETIISHTAGSATPRKTAAQCNDLRSSRSSPEAGRWPTRWTRRVKKAPQQRDRDKFSDQCAAQRGPAPPRARDKHG